MTTYCYQVLTCRVCGKRVWYGSASCGCFDPNHKHQNPERGHGLAAFEEFSNEGCCGSRGNVEFSVSPGD